MKLLMQYLRSKAVPILLFVLFAGILAFSFSLYHLPVRAVLYPAVLCALLGLAVLAAGFLRALRMRAITPSFAGSAVAFRGRSFSTSST